MKVAVSHLFFSFVITLTLASSFRQNDVIDGLVFIVVLLQICLFSIPKNSIAFAAYFYIAATPALLSINAFSTANFTASRIFYCIIFLLVQDKAITLIKKNRFTYTLQKKLDNFVNNIFKDKELNLKI